MSAVFSIVRWRTYNNKPLETLPNVWIRMQSDGTALGAIPKNISGEKVQAMKLAKQDPGQDWYWKPVTIKSRNITKYEDAEKMLEKYEQGEHLSGLDTESDIDVASTLNLDGIVPPNPQPKLVDDRSESDASVEDLTEGEDEFHFVNEEDDDLDLDNLEDVLNGDSEEEPAAPTPSPNAYSPSASPEPGHHHVRHQDHLLRHHLLFRLQHQHSNHHVKMYNPHHQLQHHGHLGVVLPLNRHCPTYWESCRHSHSPQRLWDPTNNSPPISVLIGHRLWHPTNNSPPISVLIGHRLRETRVSAQDTEPMRGIPPQLLVLHQLVLHHRRVRVFSVRCHGSGSSGHESKRNSASTPKASQSQSQSISGNGSGSSGHGSKRTSASTPKASQSQSQSISGNGSGSSGNASKRKSSSTPQPSNSRSHRLLYLNLLEWHDSLFHTQLPETIPFWLILNRGVPQLLGNGQMNLHRGPQPDGMAATSQEIPCKRSRLSDVNEMPEKGDDKKQKRKMGRIEYRLAKLEVAIEGLAKKITGLASVFVATEPHRVIEGVTMPLLTPEDLFNLEAQIHPQPGAQQEGGLTKQQTNRAALMQYLKAQGAASDITVDCFNAVMGALLTDSAGYWMNFGEAKSVQQIYSLTKRVCFGAVAPTVRAVVIDAYSAIASIPGKSFTLRELKAQTVTWFSKRKHSANPAPPHPFEFSENCCERMEALLS
ncbi:uncharacterized protein LOC117647724 [Thrips palmi]|uniref:Uncharacterized protein LOC117647724 n=1 Tax=Thrips palmi TaxID=161013 RepID=A0A6P8ZBR4_THRPL|nr:uncharacterized protein LOC117647724 [Thrips palmi]